MWNRIAKNLSGGGNSSLTNWTGRMPFKWDVKSRKGGTAHV